MSHFPRLTPDLGGGGDRGIISTNSPALQWEKIWWGYWRREEHLTPAPAPHTPPWDWQSSSLTLQCIFKWSSRFCGFSQDDICKEALVIRHCSKSREMTECNCSSVKLSSPDWTLPLLLWPNNSSYSILSLLLLILFSFDIIKTMNLLSPSPFYLCKIYLVWGVLIEDPGPCCHMKLTSSLGPDGFSGQVYFFFPQLWPGLKNQIILLCEIVCLHVEIARRNQGGSWVCEPF